MSEISGGSPEKKISPVAERFRAGVTAKFDSPEAPVGDGPRDHEQELDVYPTASFRGMRPVKGRVTLVRPKPGEEAEASKKWWKDDTTRVGFFAAVVNPSSMHLTDQQTVETTYAIDNEGVLQREVKDPIDFRRDFPEGIGSGQPDDAELDELLAWVEQASFTSPEVPASQESQ